MTDWNNPNTSQVYTDHFKSIRDKDNDLALMFDGVASTNLPIGAIRINSGQGYRLEKWDGTTWNAITAKIGALGTAADKDVGTAASQIPLNSDLGTAANRNVGAASSEVPLNSDLGTAATKNVGTASTNVPQNSDLGTAATKAADQNLRTTDNVTFNNVNGSNADFSNYTASSTQVWAGTPSSTVSKSSLTQSDNGWYLVKDAYDNVGTIYIDWDYLSSAGVETFNTYFADNVDSDTALEVTRIAASSFGIVLRLIGITVNANVSYSQSPNIVEIRKI